MKTFIIKLLFLTSMLCPNCSYDLVFLPRGKYKCSLCYKLFLPKQAESYNFRIWNKKQKENDIHNLKFETKGGRPRLLTDEERKIRSREQAKKYYYKNKEKIKLKTIEYRKSHKEKHNNYVRKWRQKTLSKRRIQWQMQNFRKRLKQLALQCFKSNNHKTSNTKIIFYPPTISLSHLLF